MKKLSKTILSLILIFSLIFVSSLTASAEVFCDHKTAQTADKSNGSFTYNITDDGVIIKSADEKLSGKVTIPSEIENKPVTELRSFLFLNNTKITSVTLPETLKTIGSRAFEGCSALISVIIPDSVTRIESEAFRGCTSLETVKLPSSLQSVEWGTFEGCTALNKIDMPESLSSLAAQSFENTGIYNNKANWENGALYIGQFLYKTDASVSGIFTVKEGTKHINIRAFANNNDIEEIVLPEGLISISAYAFNECTKLKKVVFPSTLKTIDQYAFYGCNSLEEISLPASLEAINGGAFSGTAVKSLNIPGKNTVIGNNAFENCKELSSVVLADGISRIGEKAFNGCEKLEDIQIPASVTEIGESAFDNTAYFNKMTEDSDVLYINNVLCRADKNITGEYVIRDGTVAVSDGAFSDCKLLEAIKLPASVERIGKEAFYNCDQLKSIAFPDKISEISYDTLFSCDSLEEISIGKNVKEIDLSAFRYCPSLNKITVSDGNQYYSSKGPVLFNADKTVLIKSFDTVSQSYTIPSTVKEIGEFAFSSMALKTVKLHNNIEKIGANAFSDTAIYSPENRIDGCIYIDDCLISGGTTENNTKITVKDGVRLIADEAFAELYRLTEVYIPESVLYIGEHALYGNMNLKKVTVKNPDAVIGRCALTYPEGTDAVICGYSDSTAEEYAELYGLKFSSLGEAPARIKENDEVKLSANSFVLVNPEISRKTLYNSLTRPSKIYDENGKTVKDSTPLATGMRIKTDDNTFSKTIAVAGDVDKDGAVTASDARLALRASVQLEELTDVQKTAANLDGNAGVAASDARIILRASVGLEDMKTIVSKL